MELFGYLDAGTGSIILQAVIGVAVAVGVVLKAYWYKIRRVFGKGKTETSEDLRSTKNKKTAKTE